MPRTKRSPPPRTPKPQADDKLDEALKDTFPASDPVAFIEPAPKRPDDPPRSGDRPKPASR